MGFLKRLLGGGSNEGGGKGEHSGDIDVDEAGPDPPTASDAAAAANQDEIERERELLRAEALRLDNDLVQRQLRYADRSWTPPAQGGTRRAEDGDRPSG